MSELTDHDKITAMHGWMSEWKDLPRMVIGHDIQLKWLWGFLAVGVIGVVLLRIIGI